MFFIIAIFSMLCFYCFTYFLLSKKLLVKLCCMFLSIFYFVFLFVMTIEKEPYFKTWIEYIVYLLLFVGASIGVSKLKKSNDNRINR